jgi:uncharacterized membrane protein
MFVISKLLLFVTQPLAWVVLLLIAGLLLLRSGLRAPLQTQRENQSSPKGLWGFSLVGLALLVLVLQGWETLPDVLIRKLENTYATQPASPDLKNFAGIVVLGGALDSAWFGRVARSPR